MKTANLHPDFYPTVSVDSLPLNRTAISQSQSDLANHDYRPAYKGFMWDSEDDATDNWMPQGIAGMNVGSQQFITVSWHADDNAAEKGSRISFVNTTNMNSIHYRHVLLVDENYETFFGLHAGGIMIHGDTLYVADSRGSDKILMFNLNLIKEVPDEDVSRFYDYHYILQLSGHRHPPIQPSSISYDFDQDKMAMCKFYQSEVPAPDEYQAGWYNLNDYNSDSPYYDHFVENMQGIASKTDMADPERTCVWMTASYGRDNASKLYCVNQEFAEDTVQGQDAQLGTLQSHSLPPGLESLYLEENGQNLWSLSEFSTFTTILPLIINRYRTVFCIKTAELHPDFYPTVSVDSLPLNRTATEQSQSDLTYNGYDPAHKGFMWDSDDDGTDNWMPQGIAGQFHSNWCPRGSDNQSRSPLRP
jgi:hypothetical protein